MALKIWPSPKHPGAADQNNAVAAMACEGVKGVIDWDKSRELRLKLERKILGPAMT
jgi:hypothetical protein